MKPELLYGCSTADTSLKKSHTINLTPTETTEAIALAEHYLAESKHFYTGVHVVEKLLAIVKGVTK